MHLNYQHLQYFWTAAREGSISAAASRLMLAQPTVSAQISQLEKTIGEPLLERGPRRLALTETGRIVFSYAEQIFGLGRELQDALDGRERERPLRFAVGVADVVPKLVALALLQPAMRMDQPVRVICREDKSDRLLADLAIHTLDLVITDAPPPPSTRVRVFSRRLVDSPVAMYASGELAPKLKRAFPRSMNNVAMLLPTDNTALRRSIERWLIAQRISPRIVGEFEDSALMKVFGESGGFVYPAPTVIESHIRRQHGGQRIGVVPDVREHFYAVTSERRMRHPAVVAVSEAAKSIAASANDR